MKIDAHGNLHDSKGEFAGKTNSAPSTGLGVVHEHGVETVEPPATRSSYIEARAELIEAGFAPAMSMASGTDPHKTEGIANWWDEHRITAELAEGASYAQMPDDYTPSQTLGRSTSGKRRTHRMLYKGSGIAVRMPSATAVKRFADESGEETFDVPVEAVGEAGNVITGHVRVTRERPGVWSARPLGMPPAAAAQIGEAVASVLEARRPSMALAQIGDIAEARRERMARTGSSVQPPQARTWITGVGYNAAAGEMIVQIGERTYGYRVSETAYEAVATATSPGTIYNRLVKGAERVEIAACSSCRRHYSTARTHTCQRVGAATTTEKPYNVRVRDRILAEASRR